MRSVCGHSAAVVPVTIRLRRLMRLATFIPMTKASRLVRYLRFKPMVSTVRFYPVLPVPAHRLKPLSIATALILRPALPGDYRHSYKWIRFVRKIFLVLHIMLSIGQVRPIALMRHGLPAQTMVTVIKRQPKIFLTSVLRRSKSAEPKPSLSRGLFYSQKNFM